MLNSAVETSYERTFTYFFQQKDRNLEIPIAIQDKQTLTIRLETRKSMYCAVFVARVTNNERKLNWVLTLLAWWISSWARVWLVGYDLHLPSLNLVFYAEVSVGKVIRTKRSFLFFWSFEVSNAWTLKSRQFVKAKTNSHSCRNISFFNYSFGPNRLSLSPLCVARLCFDTKKDSFSRLQPLSTKNGSLNKL